MRFFTTVAALALATAVSAQDATATTTSLSPQATCLAQCDSSDICCQAACVNVPCPSENDVNATTDCAGQCTQGNGTQAETDAYAACQAQCVSSYFLTATGTAAGATGTGAAGSATATGSAGSTASATGSSASGSGSASASASGSAASASSTGNAASNTRATIAGAGLFGLIIAGLAL